MDDYIKVGDRYTTRERKRKLREDKIMESQRIELSGDNEVTARVNLVEIMVTTKLNFVEIIESLRNQTYYKKKI